LPNHLESLIDGPHLKAVIFSFLNEVLQATHVELIQCHGADISIQDSQTTSIGIDAARVHVFIQILYAGLTKRSFDSNAKQHMQSSFFDAIC